MCHTCPLLSPARCFLPRCRPADWAPRPEEGLSLRQWLASPVQLLRTLRTPVDVHLLYLPASVAQRVKAAAQARVPGTRLSTNDAVQGLLHTLVAHARGLPLAAGPGAHNAMMIGAAAVESCGRWLEALLLHCFRVTSTAS